MLVCGDNLKVMRDIEPGSIDLIYIDPPFFSDTNYKKGGAEFSDRWKDINEYVKWLMERIALMRGLLKDTGSIYVHLDYHAVHYIKVEMDALFGYDNFRREIIWSMDTSSGFKSRANNWIRGHDTILYYIMDKKNFRFEKQTVPYSPKYLKRFNRRDEGGRLYMDWRRGERRYLDERKGKMASDVWSDIMSFQQASTSKELVGYPTQKPKALLERIIRASSNEGDTVADFFCGSGTTAVVAKSLGRKYIAVDSSKKAVETTKKRLLAGPLALFPQDMAAGAYL